MPQIMQNFKAGIPSEILQSILEELRLLREEVELLIPQEDLGGYANPERIKQSYKSAIKKYPPDFAWK